ncbi:toll/interleukin-1 receptor domain-containing protein [Aeromonas mytilicola]|uniref:toll/interleukin-1 receptor domain-containing protein n=1 Tax=Aeromonas sp. Marseille-Q5825 TaxID=2972767 RepID=UPI0021C6A208|nr:toll/interleukin-1 receptor domain-containing protein [Aeromonas sp. Marseille-Q5825]
MSSVFLSHNSKDKPWVRALAERLMADDVVVWLDEAEINIGDSLIDKIAEGIKEMKFVAAIISKNSVESSWVQKEISIAMSKEVAGRKVTVLPLVIDDCELPPSLSDKLYADFTNPDNFEASYEKLLRAIGIKRSDKSIQEQKKSAPIKTESKPIATNEVPQEPEIKIIGILKDRTRQDREYSGLQDYYFQLSKRPSRDWIHFFDESRRFPRHSMWRRAWIESDCVVVKCATDELQRYHLKDLKQDVANANENLARAIELHNAREKIEAERKEAERIKRDNLLDDLDFS